MNFRTYNSVVSLTGAVMPSIRGKSITEVVSRKNEKNNFRESKYWIYFSRYFA